MLPGTGTDRLFFISLCFDANCCSEPRVNQFETTLELWFFFFVENPIFHTLLIFYNVHNHWRLTTTDIIQPIILQKTLISSNCYLIYRLSSLFILVFQFISNLQLDSLKKFQKYFFHWKPFANLILSAFVPFFRILFAIFIACFELKRILLITHHINVLEELTLKLFIHIASLRNLNPIKKWYIFFYLSLALSLCQTFPES